MLTECLETRALRETSAVTHEEVCPFASEPPISTARLGTFRGTFFVFCSKSPVFYPPSRKLLVYK